MKVIADLAQVGSADFAPQEGGYLGRLQRMDSRPGQPFTEGLKIGLPFEDDISRREMQDHRAEECQMNPLYPQGGIKMIPGGRINMVLDKFEK